jgi:hypothetical protein
MRPKDAIRNDRRWSAIAAIGCALALPACSTSGISSYSDLGLGKPQPPAAAGQTAAGPARQDEVAVASLAAEGSAAAGDPLARTAAGKSNAAPQHNLAYAADPAEQAAARRAEAIYARFDHGQCKAGWGPKPKMVNARRFDPAHPYYMEMRLRHTPLFPVGHVYIAYGRLGPDGNPADERLIMLAPVGGYAGAAIAGAVPVQGVVAPHPDDCVIAPIAAYHRSLSAADFEKLLAAIEEARRNVPKYSLLGYNCNHFMSDIAKSVGILPPANIYQPSLVYFYEMMDINEGRKVPRAPGFDAEVATLKAAPAN